MATVRMPDGALVELPDTPTPELKARVQAKVDALKAEQNSTWYERAGGYLAGKGKQFAGALGRLTGLPGQPDPSVGQVVGDVATVAAPVVAPGMTAAGLAAGATARAAGASPGAAELADAVTAGVVGVGGMVRGAVRGVRAAKDVTALGEQAGAAGPGMQQAVAAGRRQLFDPIIQYAEQQGLRLSPQASNRLATALLQAQDDFTAMAAPSERKVVTDLVDRLRRPIGHSRSRSWGAASMTAKELDDALVTLPRKAFGARRALNEALSGLYEGTPLAGKLSAAQREWYRVYRPAQHMARAVSGAKTPGDAIARLRTIWAKLGPESRAVIDPTGDVAGLIRQASRARPVGGLGGGLAATTGGVGAVAVAGHRFWNGDVSGGLQALLGVPLAAGMRYPGLVGPAVRGAAPAVGRMGVSGAARATALQRTPEGPQARAGVGRQDLVGTVSRVVGVPAPLVRAVMRVESRGNTGAISPKGARGAMQVMPGTFAELRPWVERLTGRRASIDDPLDNLVAGALYLRKGLAATGGHPGLTARYYNGGPGGVRRPLPETVQYERNVLAQLRR